MPVTGLSNCKTAPDSLQMVTQDLKRMRLRHDRCRQEQGHVAVLWTCPTSLYSDVVWVPALWTVDPEILQLNTQTLPFELNRCSCCEDLKIERLASQLLACPYLIQRASRFWLLTGWWPQQVGRTSLIRWVVEAGSRQWYHAGWCFLIRTCMLESMATIFQHPTSFPGL